MALGSLTLFLLCYICLPVTLVNYSITDPEPQLSPALQSEHIGVDPVCAGTMWGIEHTVVIRHSGYCYSGNYMSV